MAFGPGKNGVFTCDNGAGTPVDLSAYINKAGVDLTIELGDTTTFGASARTEIPGLKGGDKIVISGLLDPTLHTHFGTIYNNGGGLTSGNGSLSFVYGPMGSTSGNPKITGECFLSKYGPSTDVGNPVSFTVELTITAGATSTVY